MKLKMMDPNEIIAVIVVLIILGVGCYAVFLTSTTLNKTVRTSVGNNKVISGNRSIHAVTASAPTGNYIMWLNCTGIVNETAGIEVQAWNCSTQLWTTIQAVGAANGTVEGGNSTYRVARRTVAGDATKNHYLRCFYTVNGTATSSSVNMTNKAMANQTVLGGTVFNILGIVITISAIMSIISVIYAYMRPK